MSAGAANRLMAAERRAEIADLLRERLSLRGICRAMGVSLTWLLHLLQDMKPKVAAVNARVSVHCFRDSSTRV